MLYGIEGILNGKLFGNGEGGSSGGGITLPELTNPAGADQILEGYEAIDGSGNKLTGTHVCESGGGDASSVESVAFTVDTDAGSISSTFKTVTISGVTSATFPYSIGRLCGQIKSYPQLFGYLYRNNNTSPATIQLKCINLGSSSSVTLPAGEYELLVYYKK